MISKILYSLVLSITIIQVHPCLGASINSTAEVIIIGAGPAGIAAATKLNENGITAEILEAEPRYGGRVHSLKIGDAYVDLGAEWCHGEEGNIVYEIMKDTGILKHPNYTLTLCNSDGTFIDKELAYSLMGIFEEIYAADGTRNATESDTVGSYFTTAYYDTIHKHFGHNQTQFAIAQNAYHFFNKFVLSSEGAFSWFEPSALSDYKDCEGDHALIWDGFGFKAVLDKMMINFDVKNKIHLDKEVKEIIMDNENDKVKLVLANGESYLAKHVIFTPSVGVLKDKHRDMFSPALPDSKVQAINAIGLGAVMKVILEFPKRWWALNESFAGYSMVWTQEDRDTMAVQWRGGPEKMGLSWLSNLAVLSRLEKNPNVLACWITGEFVPDIEKMSDGDLIDGIMFAINKFFGSSHTVERPNKFTRTSWYSNPHFRGTYSYQTIASRKIKPSANSALGEPILNKFGTPKILFAGEATHPYHYSTVHGAIETGFREADRLIKLLSNKQ